MLKDYLSINVLTLHRYICVFSMCIYMYSQGWISPSTSDVEKSETAGCKDNDVTVAEHPEGTKECHPGADG